MRISELGRRAGVSPRALRHDEELGLLPARRRANGYRDYDEQDLALVAEIRSLVDLGFALEDTRPFVECLRAGHPMLREIAAERPETLVVAQLDVDANPTTTRDAGVLGMPTLRLYVRGRVVAEVVGARSKASLLRTLEPHLAVAAVG